MCLRKCNQDHVENLHSQIRIYNGFNDHPTAEGYINPLRCLASSSSICELLDKTILSGANCQPDDEHSTAHSNGLEITKSSPTWGCRGLFGTNSSPSFCEAQC